MSSLEMESPSADAQLEQPLRTVVIKRHIATDSTQLDLHVDEIVYVLEKDSTGWWGGHKEGDDTTGWFPGFSVEVRPLPKVNTPKEKTCEPTKDFVLEAISSVATPQRHRFSTGANGQQQAGATTGCSEAAVLQEKHQQYLELDNEVAKLKQEKEALEQELQRTRRQSVLDKESHKQMEDRMINAERKLQIETAERRATLMKCEQLEEKLQHRDEEVATLRRSSIASTMTAFDAPMAQSPPPRAHDEGSHQQLASSAQTVASQQRSPDLSSTSYAINPSPKPAAISGCNASARTASRGRSRRAEEEPPTGLVRQLKNAFEARSATPQRSQSRSRSVVDDTMHLGKWSVSVAAATAGSGGNVNSQASQRRSPSICIAGSVKRSGLAISTEASKEEVVFGMSPISKSAVSVGSTL